MVEIARHGKSDFQQFPTLFDQDGAGRCIFAFSDRFTQLSVLAHVHPVFPHDPVHRDEDLQTVGRRFDSDSWLHLWSQIEHALSEIQQYFNNPIEYFVSVGVYLN